MEDPGSVEERIRRNVRLLKTLRGASDADLAKAGGFSSRQVISARLSGRTEISAEDIERLAAALRVEPHVLLLPRMDAMQWAEEHADYQPPKLRKQSRSSAKARAAKARTAKRRAQPRPAAS